MVDCDHLFSHLRQHFCGAGRVVLEGVIPDIHSGLPSKGQITKVVIQRAHNRFVS